MLSGMMFSLAHFYNHFTVNCIVTSCDVENFSPENIFPKYRSPGAGSHLFGTILQRPGNLIR